MNTTLQLILSIVVVLLALVLTVLVLAPDRIVSKQCRGRVWIFVDDSLLPLRILQL